MADYTQSEETFLSQQAITHPANVVGSAQNVAGYLDGIVNVWLAKTETTANATGLAVKVQGCAEASGDNWQDIYEFTGTTDAAETEELSDAAGEAAGTSVLAVASTSNLAVGDLIYVQDDDNLAQSEFHEIASVVTNTSVTVVDDLTYDKVQNDTIFDHVERFSVYVNCSGWKRLRVVVIHQSATGSNMVVKSSGTFASALE